VIIKYLKSIIRNDIINLICLIYILLFNIKLYIIILDYFCVSKYFVCIVNYIDLFVYLMVFLFLRLSVKLKKKRKWHHKIKIKWPR